VKYASGTKRPGMQLGRVSAATKTCSIAMGGREVDVPHYEVLTQPVTWVDAASGRVPDGAMAAGMEGPDDGSATLFLCRGTYPPGSSAVQVGKVRPAFQGCAVGVGGKAAWLDRYQVAVEDERR
jgi:hypothetical protein